jgi:hypothetical protein
MSEFTVLGMVTHHSFENVQVASVATGTRSRGGPYYYVTLTNNGIETEIPNSEGQQNTADQINTFIHSNRSSLFISYNQRLQFGVQVWVTIFFLGYGIYLVQYPIVTCTFYKRLNQMVIVQKRLGVSSVLTYSFDQITRMDLQVQRTRYGREYRIVFDLSTFQPSTRKQLPLTQDYDRNHNDQASLLHLIKTFLASG